MGKHFTLFGLLLASGAAQADTILNLTPGVTPTSHDIFELHMTIFWICVVIGIVVFGVMFYSLLNHRKSKGAVAAQFHEHLWIEITWTLLPVIILVGMAIPATKVLIHMNDSEKADLTIKITGYQWKWRYEYLGQNISFFSNLKTPFSEIHNQTTKNPNYLKEVDNPLILPTHKKIRFLFTSNDVIHAWWVPDLGFQRDAIPGFITEMWTRINRAGTYYGQCVKLCGVNHAFMPIVVNAVPEAQFNDWLLVKKGLKPSSTYTFPKMPGVVIPTTSTTPKKITLEQSIADGEKVYQSNCAVCHQINGEGTPPTFPALNGSKTVKGPKQAHIDTVLNGRPGTAMQAFKDQLVDEDIAAVITYERNAWNNKSGELIKPEEIKLARDAQTPPSKGNPSQ